MSNAEERIATWQREHSYHEPELLFIKWLRMVLEPRDIANALEVVEGICHECWDNYSGCRCWDDS